MVTAIVGLILAVCVLLVVVILAQNSKGGLADFSSGASQVMGAKRSTDTIEKATWVLVAALFIFCLGANLLNKPSEGAVNGPYSPNVEAAKEKSAATTSTGTGSNSTTTTQDTTKK